MTAAIALFGTLALAFIAAWGVTIGRANEAARHRGWWL